MDELTGEVKFENFTFFNDSLRGNWYSKIKMEEGVVKLMYSSEDNIYYEKVDR